VFHGRREGPPWNAPLVLFCEKMGKRKKKQCTQHGETSSAVRTSEKSSTERSSTQQSSTQQSSTQQQNTAADRVAALNTGSTVQHSNIALKIMNHTFFMTFRFAFLLRKFRFNINDQ
jgi:hypothetical protein